MQDKNLLKMVDELPKMDIPSRMQEKVCKDQVSQVCKSSHASLDIGTNNIKMLFQKVEALDGCNIGSYIINECDKMPTKGIIHQSMQTNYMPKIEKVGKVLSPMIQQTFNELEIWIRVQQISLVCYHNLLNDGATSKCV